MANMNTPTMEYAMGADYSWLAPLSEGVSNVVKGVFGKEEVKPQTSAAPAIPWLPIIGIGAVVVVGAAVMGQRKRRVLA